VPRIAGHVTAGPALVSCVLVDGLLGLDDGRRLRAAGNQPGAVAQLETAHHLFSELGADPYVQLCAAELAALKVAAAPQSPARLLGLSRASWLWLDWSPPE
jgi:hypothetical protein